MKLKKSFCSRTIIKNDLKMVGFLGVLYTVFLFLSIPVQNLARIRTNLLSVMSEVFVCLDFLNSIFLVLGITVPVVIAIILFRYIQETRAVAKIHSLPFTRNQILHSHIISGIIITILPVVLNCGLLIIGLVINGYSQYLPIETVFIFCGEYILLELVVFLATIMIGMMVGSTVLNVILTYILLVLPIGLAHLVNFVFQKLLYGYPYNGDVESIWYKLSPLFCYEWLETGSDRISVFSILFIYTLLFYAASRYLYNKRDLERSNEMICFDWIKYIFIFGVTFCSMLFVGIFFREGYTDFYITFTIGSIIGALIGYVIATAIAYKTLRVYRYYKGFTGFTVAVLIAFSLVGFDAFGYETAVPEADEVEFIYFSYNGSYGANMQQPVLDRATVENEMLEGVYSYCGYNTYEEAENIENIVTMHQNIVDAKDDNNSTGRYTEIMMLYKLKSGGTLFRKYYVDSDSIYNELKPVYESDEFAEKNNDVFRNDEDDVFSVEFRDVFDKVTTIVDEAVVDQLVDLVQEDIRGLTYEDHLNQDGLFTIIFNYKSEISQGEAGYTKEELSYEYDTVSYTVKSSYEKTIAYLELLGYYEDLVITADKIESLVLFDSDNKHYISEEMALQDDLIWVYDEAEIASLVDNIFFERYWDYDIHNLYSEDEGLDVIITLKNGERVEGFIVNENRYEGLEIYINYYENN